LSLENPFQILVYEGSPEGRKQSKVRRICETDKRRNHKMQYKCNTTK